MRLLPLMLGLACLVLVSCSKPPPTLEQARANMVANINKTIKDPARAERASAISAELLKRQQAMAADLQSTVDRLAALNADYGTTNEQYMALYDEYQSKRKAAQLQFQQDVFALRKEVDAQEWKEITK